MLLFSKVMNLSQMVADVHNTTRMFQIFMNRYVHHIYSALPISPPSHPPQVLHEFVADLIKFHSMQALQDLYGLGGGASSAGDDDASK
jgi:hypothetical protein